ncbi:MAG: alpha-E domain-containing protein [Verrucomicrobiota bacterium]
MLSRVADSLFWISRYLERAENISRIVDVNLQLMLDFQTLDDESLKAHWEPILQSTAGEDLFHKLYKKCNSKTVTEFLTFQQKNPNSIVRCLYDARENARMVRDQISTDMWEEVNKTYLFMRSKEAKKLWSNEPYDFYRRIRMNSLVIQGIIDATVQQDEGREFLQVGKYLERADKTTRILDVKYHILLPSVDDVGGAIDKVQWGAILRSASAYDAYKKIYVSDVVPWKVAELLILSEECPRSIRYCMKMLDLSLRNISGTGKASFSNSAEKLTGRLLSELNYSSIEDIFKEGLHEYLDQLQDKFNKIGKEIFKTYIFTPMPSLDEEIDVQFQQQQQQQ